MAQFLADIAGLLAVFAIAGGLVVLHRARAEAPAALYRAAGLVLIVGGLGVGLCTTYYWLQYRSHGEFATAYMPMPANMMMPDSMSPGMMGQGMMGRRPMGMDADTLHHPAMQPAAADSQ